MALLRSLALGSVLAALVAAAPASAYAPATSPGFFGVNGTYLGAYDNQPATLDAVVGSMRDQGAAWARIVMSQYVSERQEGVFNWGQPDLLVGALARHGIRPAPVVVGTAPWAADPGTSSTCGSRSRPADVEGWADWVGAAVKRYGPNGSFWAGHPELPKLPVRDWEIGNEPNFGNFWCPGANPEQYASVYSASAAAIRAVDPQARAVLGGLMGVFGHHADTDLDVPTFLQRMIAADPGLRDRIPAVGIHPYEGTPESVLIRIGQFREALRDVGMGSTPMIVNEFGWRTSGPSGPELATEEERASRTAELADELWRTDCGVEGMAPFAWVTAEQDPAGGDQWFGLADPSTGEPYPSGLAYGREIQVALGRGGEAPPSGTLNVCGPKRVNVTKQGSGTVTSGGMGIDCGASCDASLEFGTELVLTATPAPGYSFAGWSGCSGVNGNLCWVAPLTADRAITARFVAPGTTDKSGATTAGSIPDTRITGASIAVRSRRARFAFNGEGGRGPLRFACRIDRKPFRSCTGTARYAVRRGRHRFTVVATDESGRRDPTPAVRSFTIRRR